MKWGYEWTDLFDILSFSTMTQYNELPNLRLPLDKDLLIKTIFLHNDNYIIITA